jgi:hypothetical protein
MIDIPIGFGPSVIQTARTAVTTVPTGVTCGQLAGSSATLYTAPSTTTPLGGITRAILTSIVFCNTDSGARTITIYLVENGGSAAANRAIISGKSLAANETYTFDCGHFGIPLQNAETVRGLASAANFVTYRISVVEYL